MEILPTHNARDNALHQRMYGHYRPELFGKSISLEQKALEDGKKISDKIWDYATEKARGLLKYDDKIEELEPLVWQAKMEMANRKIGKGAPLPEGVTTDMFENRVKILDSMLGELKKRKDDYIKNIVYTQKEQVNKVYTLKRAKKMADKLFRQQIFVSTTKFLAVDGPGQMTQALSDLVELLFHDVLQNRREKE